MKCKCMRCEYEWESLVEDPKICPRCKSYAWNKPRVRNKEGKNVCDKCGQELEPSELNPVHLCNKCWKLCVECADTAKVLKEL